MNYPYACVVCVHCENHILHAPEIRLYFDGTQILLTEKAVLLQIASGTENLYLMFASPARRCVFRKRIAFVAFPGICCGIKFEKQEEGKYITYSF